MSRRLRSNTTDFNAKQARENIETYARKIDSANPKLHLFSKATGELKIAAISKELGFYGASVQTIRKFFSDEPQVFNADTFEEIAKHTGIHEAYWRGQTTETNKEIYEKQRIDRLDAEEKAAELERIQKEKHREEVARYKMFFGMLGYRYEGADIDDYAKPSHTVSKCDAPETMQGLSVGEMSSLMNELSDALGYWLYKKSRESQ